MKRGKSFLLASEWGGWGGGGREPKNLPLRLTGSKAGERKGGTVTMEEGGISFS